MGWQQDVFAALHNVLHISMSMQVVDPTFELSSDYLQSLMMVVALVLALGFSMLILLALFLCMVISFAPPVTWPSWSFRLLVISCAVSLVFVTSHSLDGTASMQRGTAELSASVAQLQGILHNVSERVGVLTAPVSYYNKTVTDAAKCIGCFELNRSAHLSNATKALCGHPLSGHESTAVDGGLLSAGGRALRHGQQFLKLALAAPPQAAHTAHVIADSATWHAWATMLPFFALTMTASAIVGGGFFGQRNLLLLAQFVGVIVWWMMCAVVSVEIAMAVGFSDACGAEPTVGYKAVATLVHVMRDLEKGGASQRHPNPPEDYFYTNLTSHYLTNCSTPNPASAPLRALTDEAALVDSWLRQLHGGPHAKCYPAALPQVVAELDAAADFVLAPTAAPEHLGRGGGGEAALRAAPWRSACGGHGPMAELFREGTDGLCEGLGIGFVELFMWQCAGGMLLLVLSLMTPGLWHSLHLPPPSVPTRRQLRAAVNPRSPFFILRCLLFCVPCMQPSQRRRWRLRSAAHRGADGGTTALLADDAAATAPLNGAASENDTHALMLSGDDGGAPDGDGLGGDSGGGGGGGGGGGMRSRSASGDASCGAASVSSGGRGGGQTEEPALEGAELGEPSITPSPRPSPTLAPAAEAGSHGSAGAGAGAGAGGVEPLILGTVEPRPCAACSSHEDL